MKLRESLVVLALIIILGATGFYFWQKSASLKVTSSQNSPIFTPPSYLEEGPKIFVTQPLYIPDINKGGLTAEQKRIVDNYKKEVLARIMSREPLSQSEKIIFSVSISTTTKPVVDGLVVADQRTFQFTDAEIDLISGMLQK